MIVSFLLTCFSSLVYLLIGYRPKSHSHKRKSGVREEIDNQIKRYIGFKVLLSAITGLITGVSLMVLRVDLALVFGLLAFLLNFIPNVSEISSVALICIHTYIHTNNTRADILTLINFSAPTLNSHKPTKAHTRTHTHAHAHTLLKRTRTRTYTRREQEMW